MITYLLTYLLTYLTGASRLRESLEYATTVYCVLNYGLPGVRYASSKRTYSTLQTAV